MRNKFVAGNWKMNKTPSEAAELVKELIPVAKDADTDVAVCVPFTAIATVAPLLEGTNIGLGAQNMHFEEKGAYTGEISADMLLNLGVKYVIIGHSERRQYFAETDETVNKKVTVALAKGLLPILCVGESLRDRELGITNDLIRAQVKVALNGVSAEDVKKVTIAYEPIWAIGTGVTATSDQAEEVCADIRCCLGELYGKEVAEEVIIQYGGSMNGKNAAELLAKPNIDGGLIGGAALKAEDFSKIINYKKA